MRRAVLHGEGAPASELPGLPGFPSVALVTRTACGCPARAGRVAATVEQVTCRQCHRTWRVRRALASVKAER